MDRHLITYYTGIAIVFVSHIYVLTKQMGPAMNIHAYINLLAGVLIAYYFMNKEGFIKF